MVGDYQLTVIAYSYSNPESKCAVCRDNPGDPPGCCDEHETTDPAVCGAGARGCEIDLTFCPRRLYTNDTTFQCPNIQTTYTEPSTVFNVVEMDFNPDIVFDLLVPAKWVSFCNQ